MLHTYYRPAFGPRFIHERLVERADADIWQSARWLVRIFPHRIVVKNQHPWPRASCAGPVRQARVGDGDRVAAPGLWHELAPADLGVDHLQSFRQLAGSAAAPGPYENLEHRALSRSGCRRRAHRC
jgi:hypothetical protein